MNGLFFKGKKIADKGYIINLPERTDRLESTKKILNELGFHGYEVFSAIKLTEPKYKKLGCTASYLSLFTTILASSVQDIIVFEDDIKLMNNTNPQDLDNIFQNWEEIKETYDVVALGTRMLSRTKIKINGPTHGSFEEMLCTQSFYYKREIIQHTYEQLKTFLNSESEFYRCTIDMFLNDCSSEIYRFVHSEKHKKFKFGVTLPMIFSQSNSYSDNEGREQDYDKIIEKGFNNSLKFPKAYVLCSTSNYIDILTECARSIREFSDLPIIVYLINSDEKIKISNTLTIKWNLEIGDISEVPYFKDGNNFYIDRKNPTIYQILIQRPLVVKDALRKYSEMVCYVDSDSVATPLVDTIFSYFEKDSSFPYFVEGIYEFLKINGRGGGGALGGGWTDTLEHNACELFNVDQTVRKFYRQTGYFVAGQNTLDFLDEWSWMCNHPKILSNISYYAPYNEETISNVLLWKYNIQDGLPYIYVNGTLDTVKKMYKQVEYKGPGNFNFDGNWLRIPHYREHLLFFHGEKNIETMREMVKEIKNNFEMVEPVKKYDNIDPKNNWGDIITKTILEHFSKKKLNEFDVFHFDENAIVPHKDGKILGVGSIMVFTKPQDYVWGAGIIDGFSVGDKPKKIYSVRGPRTRKCLIDLGWDVPEKYGDPALLFPKIYNPNVKKKYRYGLIPHYIDFQNDDSLRIINKIESYGIKIINITAGVYEFVDELLECEFILSSSLHGLIVSDAYKIPNHRVTISSDIVGGDFKFLDYFDSVGRINHNNFELSLETNLDDIKNLDFVLGDTKISDELLKNTPWDDSDCDIFSKNKKFKVLFLAPHLSTGGMPSYVLKRIESISKYYPDIELYLVEFCLYSTIYVVQRDKIKNLIPENRFWTINHLENHSEENSMKLIDIIKSNSIDIVHIDEIPEGFDSFNKISKNVLNALFDNNRTWRVVETCHNIWFDPKNLSFIPDGFAFCTPYHEQVQFKDVKTLKHICEFPIESKSRTGFEKLKAQEKIGFEVGKVHILNVGLWTEGKNQGEGVEIARLLENIRPHLQFHFVGNQASNFEKYWGPIMKNLPSNVKVWGEREDIDDFMKASDILMFNSTWECNPIVLREAASYGLKILARNLPQYFDMFTPYITPIEGSDVSKIKDQLISLINKIDNPIVSKKTSSNFAKEHIDFYKRVMDTNVVPQNRIPSNLHIIQYYIEQPYLELKGDSKSKYKVQFFDEKGVIHYENTLPVNSWVKLNRQYFTRWRTKIYDDKTLVLDRTLNYEGQRIFISFDSKSLGDSVSWIPYCLEFKNKHKCDVIVSTFWNKLFKKVYPELEFVEPGTVVHNIHGMYKLGWFWDKDREPEIPNTIPLQKAATNILGLDYTEIKPRIDYHISQKPYEGEYVTIATNSTAGCKFWTKEGWQELINYLVSQGYRVVNVSKEDNHFDNVTKIKDISIENTMNVIHHSEFFIGLSSGLSWLSWGMGKKVVMISNFTTSDHEFNLDCIRITNPLVCNGCWNNPEFKFDKGDWNWCPVHKDTDRQFECHKSITSQMVIDKIQPLLK